MTDQRQDDRISKASQTVDPAVDGGLRGASVGGARFRWVRAPNDPTARRESTLRWSGFLLPHALWTVVPLPVRAVLALSLRRVWRALPTTDRIGVGSRTPTLSPADQEVLLEADLERERIGACARLFAVGSLALVLAIVGALTGFSSYVAAVVASTLAVSLFEVAALRRSRSGDWLSWLIGLSDVAILLAIILVLTRFHAALPAPYRPALIETWGFFVVLALSTLRGRPWLTGVQTVLLAGGLLWAVSMAPSGSAPVGEPAHALSIIYASGQNAVRIAVLLIAGGILMLSTLRARRSLLAAIVSARRASNLSRYFAPTVAAVVADAELAALRQGRQQDIAVLFVDVRGFTALSETMQPREIAGFLTAFRARAAAAIEAEGGIIDKFVGDEVMGLFGVPTPSARSAASALRATRSLFGSIEAWNAERLAAGLAPVAVGVGIDFGPAFVGVVGKERLEFTVLGRTVNVARRLEELTKHLDQRCIVSQSVLRSARRGSKRARPYRALPAQTIRGCSEAVEIFALLPGGGGG